MVVAIIGVLITILIPKLVQSPGQRRNRTKCGAVLKQWANAIHSYSAVNERLDYLIRRCPRQRKLGYDPERFWYNYLGGGNNLTKVHRCPMWPYDVSGNPTTYVMH